MCISVNIVVCRGSGGSIPSGFLPLPNAAASVRLRIGKSSSSASSSWWSPIPRPATHLPVLRDAGPSTGPGSRAEVAARSAALRSSKTITQRVSPSRCDARQVDEVTLDGENGRTLTLRRLSERDNESIWEFEPTLRLPDATAFKRVYEHGTALRVFMTELAGAWRGLEGQQDIRESGG